MASCCPAVASSGQRCRHINLMPGLLWSFRTRLFKARLQLASSLRAAALFDYSPVYNPMVYSNLNFKWPISPPKSFWFTTRPQALSLKFQLETGCGRLFWSPKFGPFHETKSPSELGKCSEYVDRDSRHYEVHNEPYKVHRRSSLEDSL